RSGSPDQRANLRRAGGHPTARALHRRGDRFHARAGDEPSPLADRGGVVVDQIPGAARRDGLADRQGGDRGAALVAEAEARLRRTGIVATTQMTDMLVPPVLGW